MLVCLLDERLRQLADEATDSLVNTLIKDADSYLGTRGNFQLRQDEIDRNLTAFSYLHPAKDTGSLTSIISAGWITANDKDLWKDYPAISQKHREVLNELVLKTAQVLEVNELLED